MDRKSVIFLALLGVLIIGMIVYQFSKPVAPEPPKQATKSAPAITSENESPEVPHVSTSSQASSSKKSEPSEVVIREEDKTPFMKSEIAEKWMDEMGYTLGDIADAQQKIRDQGMSEELANDPGVILRNIKTRHTGNISISEIIVASEATAGQPIPFSLKGTAPSPTFNFTRFDILIQDDIIRIRALGNSEGETDSGLGDQVMYDGQIDPLPPGNYRIEIPELGPMGIYPITVNP